MKNFKMHFPNKSFLLTDFISDENLKNEINEQIANRFNDYACVRITSQSGNGSSFLLHAIANELNKQGSKVGFLQFKKGESILDLDSDHIEYLLKYPIIFIDDIHCLYFDDTYEIYNIFGFLSILIKNNIKLIYSIVSKEDFQQPSLVDNYFSNPTKVFFLNPISSIQRRKWANKLLDIETSSKIPSSFYKLDFSNSQFQDFLSTVLEKNAVSSDSQNEILDFQEKSLREIEMEFYNAKITYLQLQELKGEVIKCQKYEQASEVRNKLKNHIKEFKKINADLFTLSIVPKPSIREMDIYKHYILLKNYLTSEKEANLQVINTVQTILQDLQGQKTDFDLRNGAYDLFIIEQEINSWNKILQNYITNTIPPY